MNGAKMETEARQQELNPAGEMLILEHRVKLSRKETMDACRRAVECLERFAAKARQELDRSSERDPVQIADLPGQILEASVWGAANTATELANAMREAAAYMKALGELEGKAARGQAAP
jgi:uncharacterized protein YcaQ